ncbi:MULTISPECIES: winged helix-turn-helix domain-containing protein [unclassified Haladaptatus]|uniref:winged helix-turn-helix transcriptional regulator n=1 Tax=unclassified Haladaptatus TaxID=2622732 RepID=UPI00209C1169|nr:MULTISPECIES: winged helix-turn-helix domain-containing protein [unclassified Haladaptatus]MCO8243132.1 winged helix-turn-helix domain-containing protein [Haladaptatus sp. AB643]MCO8252844.1 winged helix-turn-helix domain-containing protein [Haladaptatus sp. AB618]
MKSKDSEEVEDIDPYLKEQNEGIFNAFAREDHSILTTSEIAEHVNLVPRQVRRRLDDLEDEGIVGSRKPGRSKLWWLQSEVREPTSAQYPIIQLIQERISLQLAMLGILSGVLTVIFTSISTVALAYDIIPPFISTETVIRYGLLASMVSAGFFIASGAIAAIDWMFRHLGIEIKYNTGS